MATRPCHCSDMCSSRTVSTGNANIVASSQVFCEGREGHDYTAGARLKLAFWYPDAGPYDVRLGHARLGDFVGRLSQSGYEVKQQARLSSQLARLSGWGLFPAYHEKTQAGLRIFGHDEELLYSVHFPGEFIIASPKSRGLSSTASFM